MAKIVALDTLVSSYWGARKQNGIEGLVLLNKCIERTAKHRDWDAMARFLTAARQHGQGAKVARIIYAAFGDRITFRTNVKHPAGGTFVIGWEGEFDLKGSNTYGVVRQAVANGTPWDLVEFQKELPAKEKKVPEVTEAAYERAAKALARSIKDKKGHGFDAGKLINMIQAEMAKAA